MLITRIIMFTTALYLIITNTQRLNIKAIADPGNFNSYDKRSVAWSILLCIQMWSILTMELLKLNIAVTLPIIAMIAACVLTYTYMMVRVVTTTNNKETK